MSPIPRAPMGSHLVLSGCPKCPRHLVPSRCHPFQGPLPNSAPLSLVLPLYPPPQARLVLLVLRSLFYILIKRPEINLVLKCPSVVSGSSQPACGGGHSSGTGGGLPWPSCLQPGPPGGSDVAFGLGARCLHQHPRTRGRGKRRRPKLRAQTSRTAPTARDAVR